MLRILVAQLLGHEGAPVATLSREFRVAQNLAHQRDPEVRCPPPVDSGLGQRGRKAETRQRGHDYVEGVRGIATMRRRISQRPDYLGQIPKRPRPPMRQNQRNRFGSLPRLVNEMDWNAVDRGPVMRE